MKKQLLVLLLLSMSFYSSAQVTFQKTFGGTKGDYGNSVQQTSDGGFIIAGYTFNFGAGNADFYLVKTDVNGDTLWTKTFGGIDADYGTSVRQTVDGGYIMTGVTLNFGATGVTNIYLIKTDANGDSIWTKAFGGALSAEGNSVQQTSDGGYIIVGNTNSFGAGTEDAYLIKTDANGDSLWTKTLGGANYDICSSVQQTSDGGYILAGFTASFGAGDFDVYLIKTDSIGNALWSKTFGGTQEDEGTYVQQAMDGGYIITGYTYSFGAGNADVFLIKTDSNGDSLWSKTFGGINYDRGNFVQQTTDRGYIIAGQSSSFSGGPDHIYLIKTDSIGDLIWNTTYGGTTSDETFSAQQTSDGGYIIGGRTWSFGAGDADVFLIKTDTNGNSGCNQGNPLPVITAPATQTASAATFASSPPTIEDNPGSIIGSGGNISSICNNVSIKEIVVDNSFITSPNPSAGDFIISFEKIIMKGKVEILNILGEDIFSETIFNESKKEINLKNISGGVYFVKAFDSEKYYCKKIIIAQN